MVGNGGQSSRAVGVELHLRTAVWGQQAVLALSGLAAVPDRRLVDQRRGDSGQRRPDVFDAAVQQYRSEERRVGKEGRSRWSPYHLKKKKTKNRKKKRKNKTKRIPETLRQKR